MSSRNRRSVRARSNSSAKLAFIGAQSGATSELSSFRPYGEYRDTGAGAATSSSRPQLTDSQASNYTPQRYLAGSDGWRPLG